MEALTNTPPQGARKALGPRWSTPASLPNMMFGGGGDQSMLNPETPSKSLLGTDTSSSMLFSPPSILKVSQVATPDQTGCHTRPGSVPPSPAQSACVSVRPQETLPEEAGQNNPLLPPVTNQEETSPASKVNKRTSPSSRCQPLSCGRLPSLLSHNYLISSSWT